MATIDSASQHVDTRTHRAIERLDLEATREHLHEPGRFAEPHDLAVGDVEDQCRNISSPLPNVFVCVIRCSYLLYSIALLASFET